jgi:hypothetical protein
MQEGGEGKRGLGGYPRVPAGSGGSGGGLGARHNVDEEIKHLVGGHSRCHVGLLHSLTTIDVGPVVASA